MVEQLSKYPNMKLYIIDNASTYKPLVDYLKEIDGKNSIKVLYQLENYGHRVYERPEIYELGGDMYVVTDPDLKLNPKMPENFLEIMATLSEQYKTNKIGLALDITNDLDLTKKLDGRNGETFATNEAPYWKDRINDPKYELYRAPIDTTFALINKKYRVLGSMDNSIRIAGDFTAVHRPWTISNKTEVPPEEMEYYLKSGNKSTTLNRWKNKSEPTSTPLKGGNLEIKYPPKEINKYISHVIYINLDARKDRDESLQKQLEVFDKNKITRMSAINNPENPIVGCATSHLNAIKMARDKKYPNVLILEDDAVWENVKKGYSSFKNLIQKQYDVIMLGGTYKIYNKNTYKLNSAQSAASYLINSSYYDKIINGIQTALDDPNSDKNVDVMYTNMQKQANWYIVIPALMIQVKSISNIQKYEVDYRNLFYNRASNPENKPENNTK
jgi:hypothetical protein